MFSASGGFKLNSFWGRTEFMRNHLNRSELTHERLWSSFNHLINMRPKLTLNFYSTKSCFPLPAAAAAICKRLSEWALPKNIFTADRNLCVACVAIQYRRPSVLFEKQNLHFKFRFSRLIGLQSPICCCHYEFNKWIIYFVIIKKLLRFLSFLKS